MAAHFLASIAPSIVIFAVVAAIVILTTEFLFSKARRSTSRRRKDWNRPRRAVSVPEQGQAHEQAPADAADQLRIVMAAEFTVQPLLNKSEARVFRELDRLVLERNPRWQVMAQVSMGEILRCRDTRAYRCINAKRVDLLLMDQECQPRHAIEYQGNGHHQGAAAARDAVKKEALRRAGIGYHEVVAGHTTPTDLRRLVEKLVDSSTAVDD
jgi:hypothetical protein